MNWIRISDRKPTVDDADESGTVWVYDRVFADVSSVHFYQTYSPYYTHWMPKEKRQAPPAPKGEHSKMTDDHCEKIRAALAHEIWAAAQLAPGEGIADGVARIVALLRQAAYPVIIQCDRLDNGPDPVGCPYCKQSADAKILAAERDALEARAERLEDALEELRRKQRAVEHWNKLADDVERRADLGLLDTNVAKERADCYRHTARAVLRGWDSALPTKEN